MFKIFRKKTKTIDNLSSKFILSDDALLFITKYGMPALNITYPINDDTFYDIFNLACDYELMMMDENGNDYTHDYPEKSRYEHGDRFVTEISGQWSKDLVPDLIDLNARLALQLNQ